MQDRNQPLKAGRRRGEALAHKTRVRPVVRELSGLPPAKTRNPNRTLADVNAIRTRAGESRPISVYRQGKRNARHKPEVHRSRRPSA
ncbi:MAG TPA: hypothetical protein VK850_07635 [Candidatus Binatia bacterium]|nr:hypothetical protein [Candidatus Binatia bacterium]